MKTPIDPASARYGTITLTNWGCIVYRANSVANHGQPFGAIAEVVDLANKHDTPIFFLYGEVVLPCATGPGDDAGTFGARWEEHTAKLRATGRQESPRTAAEIFMELFLFPSPKKEDPAPPEV